jgi:diguanylate cyclase (GGDEF)-like protein
LKSACGAISDWPLWQLPGRLQLLIAGVVTAYCAAVSAGVAVTRVEVSQLWLFGLVLACGAVSVELTRRSGEPGGVDRDVYAIWDLPAAVLLPPVYVMLVPIPRMLLTQARIRQTVLHRRVYTAAAVGLAYGAASVAFHTAAPALGVGTGTGAGPHALLWMILVAGCGLLRLVLNDGLVVAAVKVMAPQTRVLSEFTRAEAVYGNAAELALGTLVTLAAAHASFALVLALPLVISLQRSLRHSQLLAEATVDAKTGLLNDRTWRRRAAAEVARSVRAGVPVAVGILDIDHFKAVNDTYGHPAGDQVLSSLAAAVLGQLRGCDIVGRIGGEEFAFVLPDTSPQDAVKIAERLRTTIPPTTLLPEGAGQGPVCVTVSIGIAVSARPVQDLGQYYGIADQALYAAKEGGRDAVWVAQADLAGDPEPWPSALYVHAEL